MTYVVIRRGDRPQHVFDRAVSVLSAEGQIGSGDLPIPEWSSPRQPEDYRSAFSMACAFLRRQIDLTRSITVLVDEVDLATFSVISSSTWSGLLAMLVLAFPEVRWVFMVVKDSNTGSAGKIPWEWLWRTHGPATVAEHRATPLFDGHGLRNWLRERIQGDIDGGPSDRRQRLGPDQQPVPIRSKVAVVLDDEPDFRNFEALMAYSRGFRVHSIETWAEARRLLGHKGLLREAKEESTGRAKAGYGRSSSHESDEFLLSIEDLYLNFPDQTDRGMSDLDKRERVLPALSQEYPLCRRFVSVAHEASGSSKDYARRREYLRKRRERESLVVRVRRDHQLVYKPAPGLYALWDELRLERVFRRGKRGAGRGLPLDFVWPPQVAIARRRWRDQNQAKPEREHSAPGRLLEIAHSLLEATTANVVGVSKLFDAVVNAVRATEALELLGGRTPTLSLEALGLKHAFEVRAACQFVGVEYHLAISKRLIDIRVNLHALAVWLHPRRKRAFVLNGEARILTRIVEILEQFGQFEEAVVCRNRLATLHRQLEMLSAFRRLLIGRILLWPVNVYADWALRSLAHYSFAIVVGVMAFVVGFATLAGEERIDIAKALDVTLKAMFTISLPDGTLQELWLGYCAATFGVLNIGLLVAYLYSRWKRK